MREKLIIIILLLLPSYMVAQQYKALENAMVDRVQIHQDSLITKLLEEKIAGAESETIAISGFRVQIYSSNSQQTAKAEAFELEKKILEEDLEVEVHVLYTPPFWKVRLGDFRTRDKANLLKAEIIKRFPELQGDTYVVRDQITVKNNN